MSGNSSSIVTSLFAGIIIGDRSAGWQCLYSDLQMAFMLMERNSGKSTIDYPIEGSQGIVDALVRGIKKNGGRVLLRARVEDILMEGEDGLWASHGDPNQQLRLPGVYQKQQRNVQPK
jgi:phytoene dehydrogenase-like protein